MKTIRSFIAVPLPEMVVKACRECIGSMPGPGSAVKWVRPESIHITLKFLGEIPEAQVQSIAGATRQAVHNYSPFQLRTHRPGAFPGWNHPRVFWIGLQGEGVELLKQLQRSVESAMELLGFPRGKRAFSPHLTLGRVKQAEQCTRAARALREYPFPSLPIEVNAVKIIKSELRQGGAVYTDLETLLLSGQ